MMNNSERLCLQWNDFKENIASSFGHLREDKDFTDVTLVCEDGQQLEVHKVILASSSPFFWNMLKTNKHPHPFVYMRGLKSEDLRAIVDFLYNGEANVFQENLDSFLAIAEELQLKGLMGKNNEKVDDICIEGKSQGSIIKPITNRSRISKSSYKQETPQSTIQGEESKELVALATFFSGDLEELDQRVKSLMEMSPNMHPNGRQRASVCKVCGKEGMGSAIKDHIEANHLEGVVLPCNLCEKTFRSRYSLRHHKRQHKNISHF